MSNMVSTGPIQASSQGIVILPDTIRAVLHERRGGNEGALALSFISIAITIAITFATATFTDSDGNPAPATRDAFLLVGILSAGATIFYYARYLINRKKTAVDSIVKEMELRTAKAAHLPQRS